MIQRTAIFLLFLLYTHSALAQGNPLQYESATNVNKPSDTLSETKILKEKSDPQATMPPAGHVPKGLHMLGNGTQFSTKAIVMDKATRTLTLWQKNNSGSLELVEAYPADYGKKDGDKLIKDDLKTPEGIYFFEEKYVGSQLDFNEYGEMAFTMDYPNFFDKRQRKTGYGIWLHSIPPTKSLQRGSRGCVVVRIEAIKKLQEHISLQNMPIVVFNQVEYVKPESQLKGQAELRSWVETWRHSWVSKNIDSYIEHYADEFRSMKMNKKQWRWYKNSLNEKYEYIKVTVTEPLILQHKDQVVLKFIQIYESPLHGDVGEKTLYIKKKPEGYKIVGEQWTEANPAASLAYKNPKKRDLSSN